MSYNDLIVEYARENFTGQSPDVRLQLIAHLLSDLKNKGLQRHQITIDILESIISSIIDSKLPKYKREKLSYIATFYIDKYVKVIFEGTPVKYSKKQVDSDLSIDPSLELNIKKEEFAKMEYDVEFLKELGIENPDE